MGLNWGFSGASVRGWFRWLGAVRVWIGLSGVLVRLLAQAERGVGQGACHRME